MDRKGVEMDNKGTDSNGRRFRPEDSQDHASGRRFREEPQERDNNLRRVPRQIDIDLGFDDISSNTRQSRDDFDDYEAFNSSRQRKSTRRESRSDTLEEDYGFINRSPGSRNGAPRRRQPKKKFPIFPVIFAVVLIIAIIVVLSFLGVLGGGDKEKGSASSSVSSSSSVRAGITIPASTLEPTSTPTPAVPPLNTKYGNIYPELQVEKKEFIPNEDGEKIIYLTFDDGPSNLRGDFLDTLDEYGAKATFFISAQFFDDAQIVESIKELVNRGHQVAPHTYSHVYNEIYSSVEAYLEDFKKINDLIKEATGEYSPIYRFPGGSNTGYNESIRKELFEEMNGRGFVYYDWDVSTGDSEGLSVSEQIDRTLGMALYYEDCIVLMHDGPDKQGTIESLHTLIPEFQNNGYSFGLLDPTVPPTQYAELSDYDE